MELPPFLRPCTGYNPAACSADSTLRWLALLGTESRQGLGGRKTERGFSFNKNDPILNLTRHYQITALGVSPELSLFIPALPWVLLFSDIRNKSLLLYYLLFLSFVCINLTIRVDTGISFWRMHRIQSPTFSSLCTEINRSSFLGINAEGDSNSMHRIILRLMQRLRRISVTLEFLNNCLTVKHLKFF